jgi:hypothetical protein
MFQLLALAKKLEQLITNVILLEIGGPDFDILSNIIETD